MSFVCNFLFGFCSPKVVSDACTMKTAKAHLEQHKRLFPRLFRVCDVMYFPSRIRCSDAVQYVHL